MESYEHWRQTRYALFDQKIDSFVGHPRYAKLRKQADQAKDLNEGCGHDMIAAADFIERIESASLDYIRDWLDGKNRLEWAGIRK